jgi:parallel beta-helix repeat protein
VLSKKINKNIDFSLSSITLFIVVFGALGAYSVFHIFASSTQSSVTYGDLNNDGVVNNADLTILLTNYGSSTASADINGDGTVNVYDLSILLSHYGTSPPGNFYYVDPAGNDGNDGSAASPWKTVQHAVDNAPAGSTVRLNNGTYSSFVVNRALTVTATPRDSPVVQGAAGVEDVIKINVSNVTLSNLNVTGCIPNQSPSGGRLEDFGSSQVRINDGADNVTVTGMTIHDSHGTTSEGLPFGCYGIMAHNASNSLISNNDIYHNGYGIFVIRGGSGTRVINNQIHDQDTMIRNTSSPTSDDYGGAGLAFHTLTPAATVLAQGNTIWDNVAQRSHDYGTDGGATEIYQASNINITGNNIFNNENILEAGADRGNVCSNDQFTNNTVRGTNIAGYPILDAAHGYPHGSVGMYLRCNDHFTVDNNSFTNIYGWVFDFMAPNSNFGGPIDHVTITNNTFDQTGQKIYAVQTTITGMGWVINNNRLRATVIANDGSNLDLAQWRTNYSFDLNSTTF